MIRLHPHAIERMTERGATEDEVVSTIEKGEIFPAKFGRTGFRRNFHFDGTWRGRHCTTKQIEAYAMKEDEGWIVITVITRFWVERRWQYQTDLRSEI
jgi:hypothetical protein